MTRVLTLRVPPNLLAKADARAARLGLDRAKYVRDLIQHDVDAGEARPRRFASADLVGKFTGSPRSATNAKVREVMRRRIQARHETNR